MKCQILFSGKNTKMSAETKFIIQHFGFFSYFSQKTKTCFLGENNLSLPAITAVINRPYFVHKN